MHLKSIELTGFKSFADKSKLEFNFPISMIVGPNGSGKSNIVEAFRFVLGEQSIKSLRGKRGEDLIFNGSRTIPRANRAGVRVKFDNKKRILNVDYDEVVLERIVHRDGTNQYLINGSNVRLRDIIELLAGANIGPTGHHIVSQGEADRILSVNPKERKEMIEEALGLKIYHYKRKESIKKLERTRQNIKEIEGLRREIKPHLKFLKKQVDKVKSAQELKNKLESLYKEYLKREKMYLDDKYKFVSAEKDFPESQLKKFEAELNSIKATLAEKKINKNEEQKLIEGRNLIDNIRNQKNQTMRGLGRIEGEISYLQKSSAPIETEAAGAVKISAGAVQELSQEFNRLVKEGENGENLLFVKSVLKKIKELFENFIFQNELNIKTNSNTQNNQDNMLAGLIVKKENFENKINELAREENKLKFEYDLIQKETESNKEKYMGAETKMFQIMAKQSEIRAQLSALKTKEEKYILNKTQFNSEFQEALVLVGAEMSSYMDVEISEEGRILLKDEIIKEDRVLQGERRRKVEKMKIKLEDVGGGPSGDILKEYNEMAERDEFLEREIKDLGISQKSLGELIKELEEKLNTEFKNGIEKINSQFQNFFSVMFGGGMASVAVIKLAKRKEIYNSEFSEEENNNLVGDRDEEEEKEEGIEIKIVLPHKRIKGLEMLSGGERALTSIALTFAISQINPPPFVILDETDATLDESNSKRYGDIIENLSKQSQLILISHNRETMSRAGVLYGITMGNDGVSKLLSVAFEEAVQIAE